MHMEISFSEWRLFFPGGRWVKVTHDEYMIGNIGPQNVDIYSLWRECTLEWNICTDAGLMQFNSYVHG